MSTEGFCTVEEALAELRAGRMIVLVDDEYRENEGDLVMAAEKITPESVNFINGVLDSVAKDLESK